MGTAPGRTEEKRSGAPLRRGGVPQKIYWEGINLNKISKKIVSLVTMAAFALTLVPAAAFAATDDKTGYTVSEATATDYNKTTVNITLSDSDLNETVANGGNILVWAEDTNGNLAGTPSGQSSIYQGMAVVSVSSGTNTYNSLSYTFAAAGDYRIYVALNDDSTDWITSVAEAKANALATNGRVFHANAVSTTNNSAIVAANGENTATAGEAKTLQFNVLDADGYPTTQPIDANTSQAVYVWAENSQGNLVNTVAFSAAGTTPAFYPVATTNNDMIWALRETNATNGAVADVANGNTLNVTFSAPGTYTIYAAVFNYASVGGTADSYTADGAFKGAQNYTTLRSVTIEVAAANAVTNSIVFNDADNPADVAVSGDNNSYTYEIQDNVTPNGVKVYTVTGQAKDANGNPAQYETLNITAAKNGIQILDNEVGTDINGEFEFRFTLTRNGEFPITISEANGDASATLTVVQNALTPVNISTVKDGGYLLAGNDPTYRAQTDYKSDSFFAGAVQFEVTDGNDKAIEGATLTAGNDSDNYNLTVTAPEGSDLKADELSLVWNEAYGVYTLQYSGNNVAKDLIPGEYTVKVVFNNSSKAATATFNLAQFGTVKDLSIGLVAEGYGASAANNNAIRVIDDQVALGQAVTATIYYVDENGIQVKAPAGLNVGVNGSNSASVVNKNLSGNPITFRTAENTASNESLIGTTITIMVMDENTQKYVEKELTIVNAYLDETLSFNPTSGAVDEDNTVTVSVVDADGNVSKVNGKLYAYVESQSNEEAKIDVTVDNNVKNGKGELVLYSNAETTADVRVVVVADNGEMYGATLNYTFGKEDPNALNTVVMTIGSTEYVVNNDVVTGDAAPYVDSNWRTMVPFRVLGETFGATVNWNEDDQTVTYTYGDTELVMTIGSDTYTLNGEEQTMDTAPVIQDGRTMVPVRFVAEDLGYTVTALENSAGLTASVVFQK